jgi:hypothetical protein
MSTEALVLLATALRSHIARLEKAETESNYDCPSITE